jgi:hypothetical protein
MLASAVVLTGLGFAIWMSLVPVGVEDGPEPYWAPAPLGSVLGMLVAGGGIWLFDRIKDAFEDAGFDPTDDLLILVCVVWFGGLAALRVLVAIELL